MNDKNTVICTQKGGLTFLWAKLLYSCLSLTHSGTFSQSVVKLFFSFFLLLLTQYSKLCFKLFLFFYLDFIWQSKPDAATSFYLSLNCPTFLKHPLKRGVRVFMSEAPLYWFNFILHSLRHSQSVGSTAFFLDPILKNKL